MIDADSSKFGVSVYVSNFSHWRLRDGVGATFHGKSRLLKNVNSCQSALFLLRPLKLVSPPYFGHDFD